MGCYTMPSTPMAPTDESDVDDDDATASDASSPNDDEMFT